MFDVRALWGSAKVALACAAVAGAVTLGWWGTRLYHENKRLGEAVQALSEAAEVAALVREADAAVAVKHNQRTGIVRQNERKANARINAAAPTWAAERVPDAVLDVIGVRDETAPSALTEAPNAIPGGDP